jgi:hypothetical protein
MSASQQPEMLGNGWSRDRKGLRDLSRWLASPAQQVEDGATGRIGERVKGRFCRICN